MRCSKCGSDNREGRKFCTKCGTPLLAACPKCGAAVEPDESFCGECGTPLGDAAPAATDGAQSATAAAGGERRHLTILFCDLVGSVTLTSQLDPEEWRATVAGYQRAASEAITRFGGEVVRYVGDGIMAFSAIRSLTTTTPNGRHGPASRLLKRFRNSTSSRRTRS